MKLCFMAYPSVFRCVLDIAEDALKLLSYLNAISVSIDRATCGGMPGVFGSEVAIQVRLPREGLVAIRNRAPMAFDMVLKVFLERTDCLVGFDFPFAARPCATIYRLTLREIN